MSKEKIINVPLDPAVKAGLERIADSNGRATIREAAKAITTYVKRNGGAK